jgi:uncharacterized protein YndB with AHSA1/START domain
VLHETFMIERTYASSPARVFSAFASEDAKSAWGDTGGLTKAEPATGPATFDFRIGGRERFGVIHQGVSYTYDALYYDIVPEQRIVYSYEMYADGVRISVSVATVTFGEARDSTTLTWTEQGVYLDGFDGEDAPLLRKGGTGEMLDGLGKYLA